MLSAIEASKYFCVHGASETRDAESRPLIEQTLNLDCKKRPISQPNCLEMCWVSFLKIRRVCAIHDFCRVRIRTMNCPQCMRWDARRKRSIFVLAILRLLMSMRLHRHQVCRHRLRTSFQDHTRRQQSKWPRTDRNSTRSQVHADSYMSPTCARASMFISMSLARTVHQSRWLSE